MQKITVLCIGKLKESYLREACSEYVKRISRFADIKITELDEERMPESPSQAQIDAAIRKEGERLISKIPSGAAVVAMCIEGGQQSSEQLARTLQDYAVGGSSSVVFVIGGSWGLSDEVKRRAQLRLSMSKMTFPHQLARVMLCEQIYRAYQISSGGKYHK